MITPTLAPRRARSAFRSWRADPSGSAGSSTTVPAAVLEASTPAAASTSPCLVSAIVVGPRRATTRTVSASIACSRSAADDPALGLADDLRGDHHDVAVAQPGHRVRDQRAEVVAGRDLGQPGHRR